MTASASLKDESQLESDELDFIRPQILDPSLPKDSPTDNLPFGIKISDAAIKVSTEHFIFKFLMATLIYTENKNT